MKFEIKVILMFVLNNFWCILGVFCLVICLIKYKDIKLNDIRRSYVDIMV